MHGFRGSIFRILRFAVLVFAIISAAVWLRHATTSLDSEQAVINAEIMQVRTPITGVLAMGEVRPGMLLKKGDPLFTIKNPRFGDRETVAEYNTLQSQVETLQGEIATTQRDLAVAQAEHERDRQLYRQQILARVEMERAEVRVETTAKLIDVKNAQLARAQARAREMEMQMNLQKESVVTMPEDGLVWSIAGKNGEQVDSNSLVMEVINPSRIWVDAFFAERHANELKPGLPATIRSLDGAATWRGHLQSIRAGVGRLAYDTTVAVPPPEMAKRQIAVRVDADWQHPFSATEFFGVGRSVEVTFAKDTGQRTVGDVLKERLEHALSTPRATTAKVPALE